MTPLDPQAPQEPRAERITCASREQRLEEVIRTLELWEASDRKSAMKAEDAGWQGYWNGRATAFGMALGMVRQLRTD